MKTKYFFLILFLVFSISTNGLYSQDDIIGKWWGNIDVMKTKLIIIILFQKEDNKYEGSIDIPQQSVKNYTLSEIEFDKKIVRFILDVPNGKAEFDGKYFKDSILGDFRQSGISGTFFLSRVTDVIKPEVTEKPPYIEEEVVFYNGDVKLAGTLTLPEYPGKHPAVIMITGSGPQDRNEEILGFKHFQIIADYFTRNGIAVLRYDDRGVGESKGKTIDESTTEEFADDVLQAFQFLKSRKDINPEAIGLCGHSEGGIVAPLAASKNPEIAFIICMAGTGVTGEEVIIEQMKQILKAEEVPEEEINKEIELLKKMTQAAKTDTGWEELKTEIIKTKKESFEKMPEEERKKIKDENKFIEITTEAEISQLKTPWFKFFITYNPVPALEKVKCPVLLLFGGLDFKVLVDQNLKPMTEALERGGNKDVTIKVFETGNHSFQDAKTGSMSEYEVLPKEFMPGFLEFMKDWILQRVSVSR